jgi:hypothetical protein
VTPEKPFTVEQAAWTALLSSQRLDSTVTAAQTAVFHRFEANLGCRTDSVFTERTFPLLFLECYWTLPNLLSCLGEKLNHLYGTVSKSRMISCLNLLSALIQLLHAVWEQAICL